MKKNCLLELECVWSRGFSALVIEGALFLDRGYTYLARCAMAFFGQACLGGFGGQGWMGYEWRQD